MDKRKVILRFLFPPHEQAAAAVGPRVRAFNNPPSRSLPFSSRLFLFTATRHVEYVSAPLSEALDGLAIIALVQAKVLGTPRSAARTSERYAGQSGFGEPLIVDIGTRDGDGQRYTATVSENRSLDPELTAIGGVFAGLFPPRAALWSSRRPYFASPTRFPSGDRTHEGMPSRDDERHHASPILGSSDAPCLP